MFSEPTHQPHSHDNYKQTSFCNAHKNQILIAVIFGISILVASCIILGTFLIYHYGKDKNSWDFRPLISSITFFVIAWICTKYRQNKIAESTAGQGNNNDATSALSLLETIVLWTLLSLTAYTLLAAIWGEGSVSERLFSGWRIKSSPEVTPLERVKTTLTTIGGIGGVSFLVIKFRQQDIAEKQHKHSEDERIKAEEAELNRKFEAEKLEANKKLVDAVQQLGNQAPQVRIAGVYALDDVADTYGSEKYEVDYNKRAFEILCGYLRTPREEDSAVESTILEILTQHLRRDDNNQKSTWSNFKLDLHGATLTELLDFTDCELSNYTNFAGTSFGHKLILSNSKFMKFVDFHGAKFHEVELLYKTNEGNESKHTPFNSGASFEGATFHEDIDFSYFTFDHEANFRNTTFKQRANFQWVKFKNGADFSRTVESSNTDSTFKDIVSFKNAVFGEMSPSPVSNTEENPGQANFNGTIFKEKADFSDSRFFCKASFRNAEFQEIDFLGYTDENGEKHLPFDKGASFENAIFHKNIDFSNFIFNHEAVFKNANFERNAIFQSTKFKNGADFSRTVASSNTDSTFKDIVSFKNALFGEMSPSPVSNTEENPGQANFNGTIFKEKADFSDSRFFCKASFRNAEFQEIDFLGYTDENGEKHLPFDKGASFENAIFHKNIDFSNFIFNHEAVFKNANFERNAIFQSTKFKNGADFSMTSTSDKEYTFGCKADFSGAQFARIPSSNEDTYANIANFNGSEFKHEADFKGAHFKDRANFADAVFWGPAYFEDANFDQNVTFSRNYRSEANFKDDAFFVNAIFAEDADFKRSCFEVSADFSRNLSDEDRPNFGGEAIFKDATFGNVSFTGSVFRGRADFSRTPTSEKKFTDEAAYSEQITFKGHAGFECSVFHALADFSRCQFLEHTSFSAAKFETKVLFLKSIFYIGDTALDFSVESADSYDFTEAIFNGKLLDRLKFTADVFALNELGVPKGSEIKDFRLADISRLMRGE